MISIPKALTVIQPFAHFIALPETHPEHKRIENRRWATGYRGPLLIHAGLNRSWLDFEEVTTYPDMVFGAAVALVDVVGCCGLDKLPAPYVGHKHAEGPFCWLLANVRPLARPVPCSGAQGLWTPSPAIVAAVNLQLGVPA